MSNLQTKREEYQNNNNTMGYMKTLLVKHELNTKLK